MPTVLLDAMLREFTARRRWTVGAASLGELLDQLESAAPRLRFRIRDESGRVRPFIRIFVNGEAIDPGAPLGRSLAQSDTVDILHSIQGG